MGRSSGMTGDDAYGILHNKIGSGGGTPGPAGVGIQKIEKTGTEGLVDTYTITYTNGQTTTYTVTNGADGEKGEKGDPGGKGDTGATGSQGPKGDTGATPNIQIGTVQTLEPGQQATASMSGTPENPVLNLGIPKGEKGDPGEDAESGSSATPRQEMSSSDTTVTLEPNKLYVFPEMASLTVTLGTPTDSNIANEWHWFFDSGETACVFTLQNQDGSQVYTDAYSIEANMRYEVSVLHNVAYIKGVSTGAA